MATKMYIKGLRGILRFSKDILLVIKGGKYICFGTSVIDNM